MRPPITRAARLAGFASRHWGGLPGEPAIIRKGSHQNVEQSNFSILENKNEYAPIALTIY